MKPSAEAKARALAEADFPALVAVSLAKARAKHPAQTGRHGAYAVILEELDEVWDVVKADGPDADYLKELVHTAAMCQRAAEDGGVVRAALSREPTDEEVAREMAKLWDGAMSEQEALAVAMGMIEDVVAARERARGATR
jgi:hypothetical protein